METFIYNIEKKTKKLFFCYIKRKERELWGEIDYKGGKNVI